MDKQYKLTDRVSKDSIKSPIFKNWVLRVLCFVCILSLSLQLSICIAPMFASAEELNSAVGTWVFNTSGSTLTSPTSWSNNNTSLPLVYESDGVTYSYIFGNYSSDGSNYRTSIYYSNSSTTYSGTLVCSRGNWANVSYKTIKILGGEGSTDSNFINWLQSNATKVITDVYDFTGETRIFNDELTLFNTTDATFTYAFNFNFEVLGVGSADYITLQRTAQNNYTMSYSFDFEGSGGLTMIYRDSPPFNDDEAEWLGGKVNRKVITFLSNPDDPEFQQWLLDNTTLFDNVNDAYLLGQQSGYNNGYEEGFANSLIGDTLSGPINALSNITLIEIQGTAITLGGVVMTAIALCLVLAFLKLYAGG